MILFVSFIVSLSACVIKQLTVFRGDLIFFFFNTSPLLFAVLKHNHQSSVDETARLCVYCSWELISLLV